MNDIKLLITDIDGTVLDNECRCTDNLRNAFKILTKNNVKIVLATGRMFMGADGVRKDLELDTPVVCYQGAMVRKGDNILHKSVLEHNYVRELIEISRREKFHLNLYNDDTLIVEDDNKQFMKDYTQGRHTTYEVTESFDNVTLGIVPKVLAIIYNEDALLDLRDRMQKKYEGVLSVVRSHKYYLEFTNIDATKGSALNFLMNYWHIKKNEVMASGDQDNDFEMLQNAGIKVAMGNASEKLKTVADFIAPTVDEDGLYTAIKKYMGNKLLCG